MKITYIGHSTLLLEYPGATILTDPFFADKLMFLKRERHAGLKLSDLPDVDMVMFSHTHADHMDKEALNHFNENIPIVMPQGTYNQLGRRQSDNIHELKEWESFKFRNLEIIAVPAKHQGNCLGYIIKDEKTVYFAGDTFMFDGINEIASRFNNLNSDNIGNNY